MGRHHHARRQKRDAHTKVPTLPGDYRGFYANVRDTLLGKAEQAVTLVDAWRVLRLLEWARESSEKRAASPMRLEHRTATLA